MSYEVKNSHTSESAIASSQKSQSVAQCEKFGKYKNPAHTPWGSTVSGQPPPRPSRPLAVSRYTPLSPVSPGKGAGRQGAGI